MRQFLAYGNSDQASFRDPEVKRAMDYMMVPGTIAAYYPDATAAFVFSSGLKYAIDPRTPLFQERIAQPRASHFKLADWLGDPVAQRMPDDSSRSAAVSFPHSFYSDDVIEELVAAIITRQRSYGGRATLLVKRLERYQLLAQQVAPNEPTVQLGLGEEGPPPSFVLAPYFFAGSTADPWSMVNDQIWRQCLLTTRPNEISPVIAVSHDSFLQEAAGRLPRGLSPTVFYWINNFDERKVTTLQLQSLAAAVTALSPNRNLVNLYGSFFSIALGKSGLWGISNGLGYSESRSWPELGATGAAPPRYYIRQLHMFLPVATAQLVIDRDPTFACDCTVCSTRTTIVKMPYAAYKKHFALAREWELGLAARLSNGELSDHLEEVDGRLAAVAKAVPSSLISDHSFLRRWATVLSDL